MKRPAVVAILLVVVVGGVAAWMLRNGATEDELELGGYFEAEQIQVGSKLAGRVKTIGVLGTDEQGKEILVEEGSVVDPGQFIVVFETDEVEAQLDEGKAELDRAREKLAELQEGTRDEEKQQAKARVAKLREKLKMFEAGSREQEIKQAEAMFERSKADADNAKTNYERQVALFERKAAAAETVDAARKTLEMSARLMEADRQKLDLVKAGFRDEEKAMAKHELEEAEAASDMAERGPREQEIKQAKASVDAAEARVRRLEILRDEGAVKAPVRCVVEAFDLQPGDLIVPGAPLATLVRRDQLWVRAFIPETEIGRVHENQTVQIKVDSFPAERFEGAVIRVNRIAEFTPRNVQTFEERQDMLFGIKVRITDKRVTEPDGEFKDALRPGMAATVYVAKKSSGLR